MRVGIATVFTPGIRGGAEFLADGLAETVRRAGHSIQRFNMPFLFEPHTAANEAMAAAQTIDFTRYDGGLIDRMICLKFPAYLIAHPRKSIWLLHQHRAAYDLFGTPYGWPSDQRDTSALRKKIIEADNRALSQGPVFTIAERVCERLRTFNGIESSALYHPPADEALFHCAPAMPFIFAPSRLETLKRQDLLLRAIAACPTKVQAIFAGSGSRLRPLTKLAEDLGIADRVRFAGEVSRAEMISLYAHAAAVFFGPLDEDYGYVTLEAMLSGKPVITCTDSGGPLEFVIDGQTGWVRPSDPKAIAPVLAEIADSSAKAAAMGQAGRERYGAMNIGWDHVVEALLRPAAAEQIATHPRAFVALP